MSSFHQENSEESNPRLVSTQAFSDSNKSILETIEKISGIGWWKVNLQTGENHWSDQFYKICGLDRKKYPATTELGLSVIHPEDRTIAKIALDNSIEKGVPYQVEKRIIWPSGEIRHVLSEGIIEFDKDRKPQFLLGTFKDITSLKNRENQFITEAKELGNILDYSIDMIFLFDANGMIAKISESVKETLGYSTDQLIGKNYVDFVYPPDLEKTNIAFKDVLLGEKIRNFEIRFIDVKGRLIHLNWSGNIKNETNQILGIARDITKLVESRKKRIEDKFRIQTILDSSPDLIWGLDRDFKLVNANNAFFKTMKKTFRWDIKPGDDLLSNKYQNPQEVEYWKFYYGKALMGKNVKLESKNHSTPTYFETKITPIEVDGEIVGLACFSRDITEKKIASEKIKAENKQLLKGQEISKIGYWESDLKSNHVYWSDEMYRIWEIVKNSQIVNFDFFFDSIHPEDRKSFLYHRNRALMQEKKLDVVYRIILAGKRIKYIHEKGEIIQAKNEGASLFRGTAQEITKEKEIELELRNRNLFIESTLNNIPLGIAVNKISDGEATYMNKAFEDIYGWPKDELVNVNDFFENVYQNPAYRSWIKAKIFEDIANGDIERMSWEGIIINTKDGRQRIINAKNIPVPDLNLMISTVFDDTDRYLAEQALKNSNERFRLISEVTNDAIWDWDLETDTRFWGEGFSKLFGVDLSNSANIAKELSSRIHPEDKARVDEFISKLVTSKNENEFKIEYRFKRNDGTYAVVLDSGTVIRNTKEIPIRLLGALQDISARKDHEVSLQLLNKNLKKANHELEISNQELEQFAYVASHDLQEPLRMITSFLGLVEKRYDAVLDEKGKKYIHFAIDGAKRMREIILDLLQFSKLDSIKGAKTWIDAKEVLETSLLFLKKKIDRTEPTIHIDLLPKVCGHKNTLIQLFQNLISNAIKYQPIGQKAEIWISAIESEDKWEFSIKDNGIGIEHQYLEKIFIIFQRLHVKGTYSGTGIGLAISKKIVDLHHGRIWAESTLGVGTIFRFTLKKPAVE
ncbi:two-component system CheB/CheR fusion protein [Algoriphagus ratkowskyi]|uniref:histidine kinase n=1 Tax=Algoriphagus ratkowskyi TaxID=57028 RepID=A0A2W7RDN1_9BACT|nr:PAS domain-containing protein [Algoriphagus ratkowskyi]PZX58231.1 two-component system CheB/CheR fusion protein [Algoriphagus ratkowskyi]TXD77888.1 PAS domain S-box protein [Algoriphagus ratkowskyi]